MWFFADPKDANEFMLPYAGVNTFGKPFHFESGRRMKVADAGIAELQSAVDTLIVIPNQNLFRVANERRPSLMLSRWPIECFTQASPALPT